MKTQISRDGFRADRRYSGVYQQQGRMITDRDWNELVDTLKSMLASSLSEVVGIGGPREGALRLSKSSPSAPLRLIPGIAYVNGLRGAVVSTVPFGSDCGFDQQVDYPAAPPLPSGSYLIYLDLWERPVTALEDAGLRDPALHGADTTTRTQVMAQVKFQPLALAIKDPLPPPAVSRSGSATLTVRFPQGSGESSADPCDPRIEEIEEVGGDFLFRLEVHDVSWEGGGLPSSPPSQVVLKWSRENGAEQQLFAGAPAEFKTEPSVFELYRGVAERHLGLHFAPERWSPQRGVLFNDFPASPPAPDSPQDPWFVRRWDGYVVLLRQGSTWSIAPATPGGFEPAKSAPGATLDPIAENLLRIHLTDLDVDLLLQDGTTSRVFVPGDFWSVPVRRALYAPGVPLLENAVPAGIAHNYLPLGYVDSSGNLRARTTAENRLWSFPRLTDLQSTDIAYSPSCQGPGANLYHLGDDTVKKALDRICSSLSAEHIAYAEPAGNTSVFQAGNPTNVAQALNLLADVRAQHVVVNPTVTGFPQIQNVQAALVELFGRPVASTNRVLIGAGGQFQNLREAILALAPTRRQLAFQLLPGSHDMPANPLVDGHDVHLSISGSGPGTVLSVPNDRFLSFSRLASFALEDLTLRMGLNTIFQMDTCPDVRIERCFIGGVQTSKPDRPMLSFLTDGTLLLRDNWIEAAPSTPNAEAVDILDPLKVFTGFENLADWFATHALDFRSRGLALANLLKDRSQSDRQALASSIESRLQGHATTPAFTSYRNLLAVMGVATFDSNNFGPFLFNLTAIRRFHFLVNPGFALSLTSRGTYLIENNRIDGQISLYGTVDPGRQLSVAQRDTLVASHINNSDAVLSSSANKLVMSQNTLFRFRLEQSMMSDLISLAGAPAGTKRNFSNLFRHLDLDRNTFVLDSQEIAAIHLAWNGNEFAPGITGSGTFEAGFALANTATISSNRTNQANGRLHVGTRNVSLAQFGNFNLTLTTPP